MTEHQKNPSANVPSRPEQPRGDRGQGDKTWEPPPGEQGISNREDDEGAADSRPEDTTMPNRDE
jgi:hypothetical protein